MDLIVVESPTKAKTIEKFLGPKYKVLSSYGHMRDLPTDELGIDIKNNFEPTYVIMPKAKKNLQALKKEVQNSETVILATDEDREGEAIAWHLTQALLDSAKSKAKKEEIKNAKRIVFHEITKSAIEDALKHPREINIDLVDSQQARRILDRIVGYKISPFLWRKVARGLSAGRVQSVAVRLIVEREREIKNFVPTEYWQILALLKKLKEAKEFEALLAKKDGKVIAKLGIKNKEEAEKILKDLKGAEYKVEKIEQKETKRNPLPPFTTSTLQQEAWKKFHFSAKFTMSIAQSLYEKGFTTYHRTDSFNLSEFSLVEAKKFILAKYGKNYWPGFSKKYTTKSKGAQEAHEAIRPTYPEKDPDSLQLDEKQYKLYDLIWRRFIASQMSEAVVDSTIVDISVKNYLFRANGQILKFDGFLKVYPIKFEETDLPNLKKEEVLKLVKLNPSQHFTQPPGRYTEATLIKALEEYGIGRPSTYAPILSTIQDRNYVEKDENKKFQPTEMGFMVNDVLVEHFPKIVDINFTVEMEKELDEIAQGKEKWVDVIRNFYTPFSENLKLKNKEVIKANVNNFEKTDELCPECKNPLVIRLSRFGKFYACSKFPECKYKRNIPKTIGIKCPSCKDGDIIARATKKRKIFYGCSNYPKCNFALWDRPTGEICEKCGALMVKTNWKKIKCSNAECESNKKQQVE